MIAYRLKQVGLPVKIIEARDRIGGRIHTVHAERYTPVEMGATWFGAAHTNLTELLDELEIPRFEQFMDGTAYFQPFSTSEAEAFEIPQQEASFRVSGGTSRIIERLASHFDDSELITGQPVRRIEVSNDGVQVVANKTFSADRIVVCLPPKLWAQSIAFQPALPSTLHQLATNTQTWMEDSIKVAFVYERPFWRERGTSGVLFSQTGPVTEFYDHTNADNTRYALAGFVHPSYQLYSPKERKEKILQQLIGIFGPAATEYIDFQELIWAEGVFTKSESISPLIPHQNNGHPLFAKGYFGDQLFFSNTETSPVSSGYMDGAVFAAKQTCNLLIND